MHFTFITEQMALSRSDPEGLIVFREPDDLILKNDFLYLPDGRRLPREKYRAVEFHELHPHYPAPLGTAYVGEGIMGPGLRYVYVRDDHRRQGVGKALVLACCEYWPRLDLGAGVSDAGDALLESVERDRPAHPQPEAQSQSADLFQSVLQEALTPRKEKSKKTRKKKAKSRK